MKQVEVTILGQSYILGCPDEGESELHQAVAMVDREMSAIRDAGRIRARERIAVLAALNLAYRLAEFEAGRGAAGGAKASSAEGVGAGSVDASGAEAATGAVGAEATGASAPGATDFSGPLNGELAALVERLDEMLAEDGRLI